MIIQRLLFYLAGPVLMVWLSTSLGVAAERPGPRDAFLIKDEDKSEVFYQNSYFGFGMMIPDDWEVVSSEELHQLMEGDSAGEGSIGPG